MPYADELRESVHGLGDWSELPFFSGQLSPFEQVCQSLARTTDVHPAADRTFAALQQCSPDAVRVVVLGQDPYPNPEHATGLAFSVPEETCPLPPTLRNISEEMRCDLGFNLNHGSLVNWARQGVLLLNSSLTVPSPDTPGWDCLITDVFCRLQQRKDVANLFWVFWGTRSWSFVPHRLDEGQMLKTYHPDSNPNLSGSNPNFHFFGSKPFSKIDNFFKDRKLQSIDWQVPAQTGE